jgi:hypothetical protein
MVFTISFRVVSDVIEEIFTEAVKSDALHETRWNDAVGINVRALHINASSRNGGNFFQCHSGESIAAERRNLKWKLGSGMGLQNRDGYPTLASEPFSEISYFGAVWQNYCWKIVVKKAVATPSIRGLMVVMITAFATFQTGGFVNLSLWFLPHITGNGHHHAEVK